MSPHPNGALKVGFAYETFFAENGVSSIATDEADLLIAEANAIYAIEDFEQSCVMSPKLLSHDSGVGGPAVKNPIDYRPLLKELSSAPAPAPDAASPKVCTLTVSELMKALAQAPSTTWKAGADASKCARTLGDLIAMLEAIEFAPHKGAVALKAMTGKPVASNTCSRLRADGVVTCRSGGTLATPSQFVGATDIAAQFPDMGAGFVQADRALVNDFSIGLSIVPNLIQVSYLPQLTGGGPNLAATPINAIMIPWSVALDAFWAHRQTYFVGLEFGAGQGLPGSITESNICQTTTSGASSAQTCQSAAFSQPSLGTSVYGTFAILATPFPGFAAASVYPGAEMLATFASISNAAKSEGVFNRATDSLVLTVPIFLGSYGAGGGGAAGAGGKGAGGPSAGGAGAMAAGSASLLGGLAPQVTIPFDSTKPVSYALTVFVGASNFL